MANFTCCGADDQGEHSDECPLHFNRKTWAAANQRTYDLIAEGIARGLEKDYETLELP